MSGADAIWQALKAHRKATADRPIAALFSDDADRFARFSASAGRVTLDLSRTALDDRALGLLLQLAEATGVFRLRDEMFAARRINTTEDRAVLHWALRAPPDGPPVMLGGRNVVDEIRETRHRMETFADGVREGRFTASDGGPFTDVVNIGIGGSHLGPEMAVRALAPWHDGPRVHFLANIDGAASHDLLKGLDPRRTLVLIVSKTFTTAETMANARAVLAWLQTALGAEAAPHHLAAVTSATGRAGEMGIPPERVFGFGDYVGGRYSLWGPVGLAIMLAVGKTRFAELLAGAAAMDEHFRTAPPRANLPLLLGLAGVWHNDICGYESRAILPYAERLGRLPAYLQQLDMESNGKRVTRKGDPVSEPTGPVVWGEPGTNGQHAFFQLLHQGSRIVPAEFILIARGEEPDLADHHAMLVANALAQARALMTGRSAAEPHRAFPGNRPSVTILLPRLMPYDLGQLIALYEHRVFVEAAIWNINAFDQWGVELGKEMATELLPAVTAGAVPEGLDGATAGLLRLLRQAPGD